MRIRDCQTREDQRDLRDRITEPAGAGINSVIPTGAGTKSRQIVSESIYRNLSQSYRTISFSGRYVIAEKRSQAGWAAASRGSASPCVFPSSNVGRSFGESSSTVSHNPRGHNRPTRPYVFGITRPNRPTRDSENRQSSGQRFWHSSQLSCKLAGIERQWPALES